MELSSPTNFPRYRTSSRLLRRPSVIVRSLREPPDVLLDVPRRALQRPWRTLAQRKSVGFAARGVRKQMSREELTFQIKLPYPKTELISSPLRVWLYGAGLRKFRRSDDEPQRGGASTAGVSAERKGTWRKSTAGLRSRHRCSLQEIQPQIGHRRKEDVVAWM